MLVMRCVSLYKLILRLYVITINFYFLKGHNTLMLPMQGCRIVTIGIIISKKSLRVSTRPHLMYSWIPVAFFLLCIYNFEESNWTEKTYFKSNFYVSLIVLFGGNALLLFDMRKEYFPFKFCFEIKDSPLMSPGLILLEELI